MYINEWLEYCQFLEDYEAYENDMLMRQWDNIEDYYNA